jgi:hypothetical protein
LLPGEYRGILLNQIFTVRVSSRHSPFLPDALVQALGEGFGETVREGSPIAL